MKWKLVPVEPTEVMCCDEIWGDADRVVYRAMLTAAPSAADDEELVRRVAKAISMAPFPSKASIAKARAALPGTDKDAAP